MKIPKGKREASGVLIALYQAVLMIWPDLLSPQWEQWGYTFIGALGTVGVLDWARRKYFITP